MKEKFQEFLNWIDTILKISAFFALLVATAAFLLPNSLWKPIDASIASMYGKKGWVYYEVGENRKTTNDGNLLLLKVSEKAVYSDIALGDKLRALRSVNFRKNPTSSALKIFPLLKGDCITVINGPKNKIETKQALSGGWLNVATSPCDFF